MILLIALFASAQTAPVQFTMSKDSFFSKFAIVAKQTYCSERSLMGCFNINKDRCEETFKIALSVCKKSIEAPREIRFMANENEFAESIGDCIGKQFFNMHFKKLKKESTCTVR